MPRRRFVSSECVRTLTNRGLWSMIILAILLPLCVRSSNAGWFFEQKISPGAMPCWLSPRSITSDWRDCIHVVYNNYQEVRYARYDGFSWVEDRHVDYGGSAQIAADPSGDIHIVWPTSYGSTLQYQRRTYFGWTEAETLSPGGAWQPSVVSDAYGTIHVVWIDSSDQEIYTRRWDGLAWSPVELLTQQQGMAQAPLLAADGAGRVHLAWYSDLGGGFIDLYHKTWDGLAWSAEEQVVPGGGSGGFAMACDAANRLHLVWTTDSPDDTDLYWMKLDEFGWSAPTPVVSGPGSVASPSLAATAQGGLELLYEDRTAESRIHRGSFDGAQWYGFEQLPMGPGVSTSPNLAALSDGSLASLYLGERNGQSSEVYFMPRREIGPPLVDTIVPPSGLHGNHAGVRLLGTGFVFPDSVWIERAEQPRILATLLGGATDAITCGFDLSDALLGSWDLVVQNPDGQRARMNGGYEVRPSTPWNPATRVTQSGGPVGDVAVAAAPGTTGLHIVWIEELGAPRRLFYQSLTGDDWTAPLQIDEGDTTGVSYASQPAIAVDRQSRVHVTWIDAGKLFYRCRDGVEWSPRVDLGEPGAGGLMTPAMAVDAEDRLVVVYRRDWPGVIECRTLENGVWSQPEAISSGGGSMYTEPALAADHAGSVYAIWWDAWANTAYSRRLVDAGWEPEQFLHMGYPPNNSYLQIAVDGDDVVHAVWTTGPLRHATLTDDGWSSTDELTVDYCSSLCLGVDTDGHLQLLYDHGGLCIREWDGVLWTEERSVDFAPLSNPAIAADPWGNEHALWIAGPDGDRELYYSRRGTPLPAPEIQAVDPIEALAFGTQDLSVTGEHFLPPCVVTLEREGHASILGAILEATQDLVRSRFDLTGADPGSWSVILLAADGQRDTLANALTLTASPWGTEERISHAPESSSLAFNSGRSLVWGSDGRLHVFWYDRRDGNYEVYWSSGQQGDWSAETRLTNDPGGSVYPVAALAQTGPIVLAWQESRDGNWEIYSKTYQAGVWSTQQRLTTNAQPSQVPSLAADATGGVHLVWQDGRDGNPEVYYRRWSGSWEAGEVRLSHNSASSLYPTVVSDGLAKTYVAWMDDRSGDWEIYYRVHDGASWGDEIRLPQHAGGSFYPSLASDGNGRVVVVFEDDRDGNLEIYAQRIDEPSAPERLTNDPAASTSPALKLEEDGTQHLVWSDDRKDGIHQVWYKTYAQGEWSLDHRLSESPSGAELPMLAVAGGAAQVVWRDSRDGNYEIYGLFPGMLNPASAPGIEGASSDFVILWYPNPFEGQVTAMIHPAAGPAATLDLYDPSGRKIRSLLPGPAGGRAASTVVWDGRDDRGRSLGPGVYLYRLRIGERSESGSIVRAR